MSRALQISCFDVDHASHPETKRASRLDRVCIASVGNLETKDAPFVADLCSVNRPKMQFLICRLLYGGRDDPLSSAIELSTEHGSNIEMHRERNVLCLAIRNKATITNLLLRAWKCYGGSWLIAADCQKQELFLRACGQVADGKASISDARDVLVEHSCLAAATFDDEILDVVTRQFKAAQMRELVTVLASVHGSVLQMLPVKGTAMKHGFT